MGIPEPADPARQNFCSSSRLTPKHRLQKAKSAITQRDISQIISRSRESTNKQLRAWSKRGWIRLERGGVTVLAPDKLAAVAAEGAEFDAS